MLYHHTKLEVDLEYCEFIYCKKLDMEENALFKNEI